VKTFLAAVGLLAITVVLAVVGVLIWLRWKIGRMAAQITRTAEGLAGAAARASSPPPFRIHLAPVEAVEWDAPQIVQGFVDSLTEAHYVDAGTFIVVPSNLRLTAFCHPQDSAYAIICEIPQVKVWMEFVSYYEDGSSVTYSNSQDTLLDRPEQKLVRFLEGFGAEELLRTFLRERPRKPLVRVSPQEFSEHFERAYAEGMDWRMARGGPTEEEVRRIAERKGQPYSPEAVQAIRARWAVAIDLFRQMESADQLITGGSSETGAQGEE
jgi:hypothetical protein